LWIVAFGQQSDDLHIKESQNCHNNNTVIVISAGGDASDKKTDMHPARSGSGYRMPPNLEAGFDRSDSRPSLVTLAAPGDM
jgi:hypothetical protein